MIEVLSVLRVLFIVMHFAFQLWRLTWYTRFSKNERVDLGSETNADVPANPRDGKQVKIL